MQADDARYIDIVLSDFVGGLFVVDATGEIVHCNENLEHLLHKKSDQLVGNLYHVVFNTIIEMSDDPWLTERKFATSVHNLEQKPVIYSPVRHIPNGRWRTELFLLPESQRSLGTWAGIIRDVSAEWKDIDDQVQYVVRLTNQLWTNLAAIKGTTGILSRRYQSWDDAERQQQLDGLFQNIEEMSRSLEYSQMLLALHLGSMKLNPRSSNIGTLIQKAVDGLTQQLSNRQYMSNIASDLPSIEVDPRWIDQLIRFLLEYVIKQSSERSEIQLAARQSGNEILISITEQNNAVPAEQLPHIFDLSHGTGLEPSATTIALQIAHKLVLMHDGRIWAERSHPFTTTFNVALAVKIQIPTVEDMTKAASTSIVIDGPKSTASKHSIKVLVVEDDYPILQLLQLSLEGAGYRVFSTMTGNSVLDLVLTKKPDVVLLDIFLPDADGLEICTQVRKVSSTPIIIVTANSKADYVAKALDLGADDYLVKPFTNTELLARIRASVRRASAPELAQSPSHFRTGDLYIDYDQRQVTIRNEAVKLSRIEYKLLFYLASNAGRVLSHQQLLAKIWGLEYKEDTNYLWVTISRLRRKLEKDPANPEYILNESGIGYYLPAERSATHSSQRISDHARP